MKKLFLLLVLCIIVNLSGFICWEESGKLVRPVSNLNYSGAVTTLVDGSFMLLWSDAGNGEQQMKIQKVSESGDIEWTEPLMVVDEELYYPNGEMICETTSGDVVIAWHEQTNPREMRFQRFDTAGNRLWGEDGITIYPTASYFSPKWKMISSEEDGVYVGWVCNETVYGIYLEEDGSIGENWSENGEVILTGVMDNSIQVIGDGFGGIVIGSLSESGNELMLQRCGINADQYWGINGIIHEELGSEDDFAILNWEEGEYAVIVRQGNQYLVNLIDANGDLEYAEMQLAGELSEGANDKRFMAVRTSDAELGLVWVEDIGSTTKLVMQKSAIGGELEWEESNFIFPYSSSEFRDINLLADSDGGLKVFLKYRYDNITNLILYLHYDSDGDLLSGEEPVIIGNSYICPYGTNEYEIGLAASGVTGLFWRESSGDEADDVIRFQYIDPEDNILFEEGGDIVHSVLSGNIYQSLIETNGENSIIAWEDSRYGHDQIYLQLINNNTGENEFSEFGIPLTDRTDESQYLESLCFSNDGETFCVSFTISNIDSPEDSCAVQEMDLAGNRLLGDQGLIFNNEEEHCQDACVDAYENGFTVAWTTMDPTWMETENTLYLERIINNEPIWGDGLVVCQTEEEDIVDFYLVGDKVLWAKESMAASQLMIQRFDDNGEPATGWGAEGLEIAASNESIHGIRGKEMIEYGEGVLVFWREYIDNERKYMGQYISDAGEILWEEGGYELLSDNHFSMNVQVYEDNIYISYQNVVTDEIVVDKFDMDGNFVWSESLAEYNYRKYWCLDIWQDIMVLYWTDEEVEIFNDNLYAKIFDIDGNLLPGVPDEGIIVCQHIYTDMYEQSLAGSVIDEAGNSIVLWKDNRGGFYHELSPAALFIQKIDLNILDVSEENIEESYQVQISNYPNPFTGSTTLRCDLPREVKDAQIDIYNIRGQKVRSLSAERNEVEWDCRNAAGKLVSTGIYLYQLSGDGIGSKASRMILIK